MVPVDGPLGAGAVGDEHQVVLREDNALLRTVDPALDGGGRLSAVPDVEDHVGDLGAEAEVHPARYFCMGRIRDSYWLYRVNFKALKSGSPAMW